MKEMLRNFKNRKKGSLIDVIIWIVTAFVVVMFFGMWMYGHQLMTDELMNTGSELVTNATEKTIKPANEAIQSTLGTLGVFILIGMIISIFISNFMIQGNPIFFILYVIIGAVGVMLSATVSNKYMDMTAQDQLGTYLTDMTTMNFIMQHLPYFAAVIAVLGGLFLYLGIIRQDQQTPNL